MSAVTDCPWWLVGLAWVGFTALVVTALCAVSLLKHWVGDRLDHRKRLRCMLAESEAELRAHRKALQLVRAWWDKVYPNGVLDGYEGADKVLEIREVLDRLDEDADG